MSTHKVVTLETLTQAMEDAQSGLEVGTTAASYVRMVYDALPTPPLDDDVLAAVRQWADDCCMVRCDGCEGPCGPLATGTIITALLAGAAANAQLRAMLITIQDKSGLWEGWYERIDRALAAEPSALAERYRALEAMMRDREWWGEELARLGSIAQADVVIAAIEAKVKESTGGR